MVLSTTTSVKVQPSKNLHNNGDAHSVTAKDSEAGRMSVWVGGFGFKVAAMQMESSDSPQKIAELARSSDCPADAIG